MKPSPPHRVLQFLRWFCREDYIEEIEGDLTEVFEKHYESSPVRARRKFFWSVIKYLRPEFIKSFRNYNPNPVDMFRHNMLISYRNFLRYKSSFFINLAGLSSGLASVLLIYLWVFDELSFDKFHENDNRLFQVMRNVGPSGGIETVESNSTLLPLALAAEIPEVEHIVPVRQLPQGIVSAGHESVKATGKFSTQDFFNAFTYRIIHGHGERLLSEPFSMAISDELALKLFGSLDCVGKTIVRDMDDRNGAYVVSGVFEKPRRHSSDEFDYVIPYEQFLKEMRMDRTWQSNPILVFLTLKQGVNAAELDAKINEFYRSKRKGEEGVGNMFFQKYSDRYLYSRYENGKVAGGRIDYTILFSVIALFILIIACINFMNLSTARASRRLKEVGIKKTIGIVKRTLIFQYLSESMLMATLAAIVAVLIVFLFLPQFNLITGKQLAIEPDGKLFMGVAVIVVGTGLIAGSYPAFFLSGLSPVQMLKKNELKGSISEVWVRKGLVVFQFGISIFLIVAVMIIYKQISFVQSRNLGYKKENVITFDRQGKLNLDLEPFLHALKNIPGVVNASSARENIIDFRSTSSGHAWEGQVPGMDKIEFSGAVVNYDFIESLNIEIKEGRSFSRDFGTEESTVVLNEAAIDAMQMADPVGQWIELFGTKREIIGIVKDFHFQSMYTQINPLFLICNPKYTNTIFVKIMPDNSTVTISKLQSLYQRFNPGIPFEVKFLDDEYQALYTAEKRVASLSKYFAGVAILISCLGLYGLAAFTTERRTKEIGIRKILGCSEFAIVRMLSADFTGMVLIAIAIAFPFGYYAAGQWLESFAYRIILDWRVFIFSGGCALLIAWITIGLQTIKASRINPSDCLRTE